MDEIDVMSWRSAVRGLRILGEKLLKEDMKAVKLKPMRKYEVKDIKKAIRFVKYLLRKTEV